MTRTYALIAVSAVAAILGGVGLAIAVGGSAGQAFDQCRGSAIAGDWRYRRSVSS